MNERDVTTTECRGRVHDVVHRLVHEIERRGLEVFALIDHSGDARDVGLAIPDTKLLMFGDPQADARRIQAHPLIALDLPLKLLVAALDGEHVLLAYNSPRFLVERYELTDAESTLLHGVESVVRAVVIDR
jgi:uncharacterized protein (DUF302 family)